MSKRAVALDDKYTRNSGDVYMSSIQALVRLPMMQRQRHRLDQLLAALLALPKEPFEQAQIDGAMPRLTAIPKGSDSAEKTREAGEVAVEAVDQLHRRGDVDGDELRDVRCGERRAHHRLGGQPARHPHGILLRRGLDRDAHP